MPRTLPSDWARAEGQPAAPARTTPYQGLRPFAERDAAYFFGRESERAVLVANLMAAKLTLVYGESGVGKSSILRAGVVHHLRHHEGDGGLAGESPRLLVVYVNRWAGNAVAHLLERIGEEITRALGVPPAEVATPSSGLAEALASWSIRWNLDLLIILDQFEEYFLYHADEDEDHPEPFATEFTLAVNRADLPVSFLVAIREDALAKLDRFKGRIPKLFENYVRIRHLRRSQAEAAIVEPLARFSELSPGAEPWSAEPELVRRVLEGVRVGNVVLSVIGRGVAAEPPARQEADHPIEAPYLQMVLTRLWTEERERGSRRLRLQTLEELEGPEAIVRSHLFTAMEGLPPDRQEVAARVFHHLVTPGGAKIGHTAKDLALYTDLPEAQVLDLLRALSASGAPILRTVPGQDGEPRYEIFHDVLSPAVLGWRAAWETRHKAEAAAQHKLEERTRRWRRGRVWAGVIVAVILAAAAGEAVRSDRRERSAVAGQMAAERQADQAQEDASKASARMLGAAQGAVYTARADAICAKGNASVEELGPRPSRVAHPRAFGRWLANAAPIGEETSRHWHSLVAPSGQRQLRVVLDEYDRGLAAYGSAAQALVGGRLDEGRRRLYQADRLGQRYVTLAGRNGFHDCALALPAPP
jgi:hypothetical protein